MSNFAFLSLGRLHLVQGGKVSEVTSQFGDRIRERALEMERRHAWKTQGAGARFMGMWAAQAPGGSAADMQISITALAPGAEKGEMLYTLETTDICGLLHMKGFGEEENRLWHSNQTRIRELARHPAEPRIACSVWEPDGTANIGVMTAEGSRLREVTEGDSLDLAPRWVPGKNDVLVYQSAGLGRNRQGHPVTYGPFEIHELDLTSGELSTVAADARFDFLAPQRDAEGGLYYIRRPHRDPFRRPWWKSVTDIFLIPFRFIGAIFHYFNFFSMRYTGKPLSEGGSAAKGADLKRMMIFGNLIDAEQQMRAAPKEEAPDLVPKDWELVHVPAAGGERIVARGVLSYDLLADGAVLYSNGSAVFEVMPGGKPERVLKHNFIERIIAWG